MAFSRLPDEIEHAGLSPITIRCRLAESSGEGTERPGVLQLAAQISQSLKLGGAAYASNSLERLRIIKRLRRRLEAERLAAAARPTPPYQAPAPGLAARQAMDDFNAYT